MKELDDLRKELDTIDARITDLLQKRFALICRIASVKKSSGIPIENKSREREILDKQTSGIADPHARQFCIRLWQEIFSVSKELQQSLSQTNRKE